MSLDWVSYLRGKGIVVIAAGLLATELAWRLYKKYGRIYNDAESSNKKQIAEVLFFTEQSSACKTHAVSKIPCTISSCPIRHLNKLSGHLRSAKRTIDLCIYFFTYHELIKLIIDAHKQNIIVRLITDDESTGNDCSQIFKLRKAGVKVRSRRSDFLMHHKFAIVDRSILIVGSANWTSQAFFGNCENIMITNESELLGHYVNEFEKLWLKFNKEIVTVY